MKRAFGSAQIAAVGFGTWKLHGREALPSPSPNLGRDPRASALAAIRASVDAGATHVDTAELYDSEELVGEALAGRRDQVFLVSKVLPANASRAGTVAACEASLKRLRTDRLDGYLLHWPGRHPLAETVAGFEALVQSGKIKSWGVSNFDETRLEELVRLVGPGKVACNQVLYHLGERAIEHAVLPTCERHGIALVAYSPFGSSTRPWPDAGRAVLTEIGAAHGGATAHQIALVWLLARHPSVLVIPKTASADRARENAAAARIVLTDLERERIAAAFPLGPRRRGIPTL